MQWKSYKPVSYNKIYYKTTTLLKQSDFKSVTVTYEFALGIWRSERVIENN